jgi:hypothetical protein
VDIRGDVVLSRSARVSDFAMNVIHFCFHLMLRANYAHGGGEWRKFQNLVGFS